jgi:hypothetical protein
MVLYPEYKPLPSDEKVPYFYQGPFIRKFGYVFTLKIDQKTFFLQKIFPLPQELYSGFSGIYRTPVCGRPSTAVAAAVAAGLRSEVKPQVF